MKVFSAATEINASPETVWAILTNGAQYPTWDTGMIRLEGTIAANQPLIIHAKISPNRAFHVTVSEFVPNRKMVWSSGMPLGLFKGERTFTLAPVGRGQTQFSLREEFSGLLLPLIGRSLPDMNPVFADFCAALKKRAES